MTYLEVLLGKHYELYKENPPLLYFTPMFPPPKYKTDQPQNHHL